MKKPYLFLLIIFLFTACFSSETDEGLLEKDKKDLAESLDSYKLSTYKFGKILIRASAERDTVSAEFQEFKSDMDRTFSKIKEYDFENSESLSLFDYISIYRDYRKMKGFIDKTDEDIFPTLTDALNNIYKDSISKSLGKEYEPLKGEEKLYAQNLEHAILSVIVLLSKDLGEEVSLYECYKTNPKLLPDCEEKGLLQFIRSFIFFEKGLYYLSESEITENIKWLDENQDIEFFYMRKFFNWGNLNNQQTYTAFHALNHVFRGFDRLMMDRKIDEERALEDFEIFLEGTKKIGLDNELTWSIESYLYLKKEDNEKAISSLQKLKTSKLLSSKEKDRIDESIEYVKNRESGKVLNTFYDKYFLSKIATKYMLTILSEIDWKKVLKEQDVPYTDKIFEMIENVKVFSNKLNEYTDTDRLKETGENLKNQGKNLWNKAKELME